MKSKRQELEKECIRFWLVEILEEYKKKLWSHKNPKLHHLARVVYSDYLLLTKSKDWKCICVTCGKIDEWYSPAMHPWHFLEAGKSLKRKFEDDNVRPQCVWCNVMKNGNYKIYTIFMQKKFGRKRVDNILQDKEIHTIKNWQYAEMILERYKTIQHLLKTQ